MTLRLFHGYASALQTGSIRRTGATTVEYALAAPILFLLVLGLIEFSRMVMIQEALTSAAREGCRTAVLATTGSSDAVDANVRKHLQGVVTSPQNTERVRVNIVPSALSGLDSGTPITTSIEVSYSELSWFPPWFLGSVQLRGTSTMERE